MLKPYPPDPSWAMKWILADLTDIDEYITNYINKASNDKIDTTCL